jgi:hypothetical protein
MTAAMLFSPAYERSSFEASRCSWLINSMTNGFKSSSQRTIVVSIVRGRELSSCSWVRHIAFMVTASRCRS